MGFDISKRSVIINGLLTGLKHSFMSKVFHQLITNDYINTLNFRKLIGGKLSRPSISVHLSFASIIF